MTNGTTKTTDSFFAAADTGNGSTAKKTRDFDNLCCGIGDRSCVHADAGSK